VTIVLRSLVVRSGSTTLVNGVALRLAPASRTALVGASGRGKSTLDRDAFESAVMRIG